MGITDSCVIPHKKGKGDVIVHGGRVRAHPQGPRGHPRPGEWWDWEDEAPASHEGQGGRDGVQSGVWMSRAHHSLPSRPSSPDSSGWMPVRTFTTESS